jgi:predicted metalloendopeptidase
MIRSTLLFLLAVLAASAQVPQRSGLDATMRDPNCKPCEDFWRHANGTWVDKNPIPGRYASWGTFTVLQEGNRERTKSILDAAALSKAPAGSEERKMGDLYAACMDTERIEKRGAGPIEPYLKEIAAIESKQALGAYLPRVQKTLGLGPFGLFGGQDLKNSKEVIANVVGTGLSLPERDYYFRDDARTKEIREKFVSHVAKMFALLGDSPEKAAANAKTVMSLETALAQKTMTNVQRRDPYSRYHKMDLAGVTALAPTYEWKSLLKEWGLAETTPINVTEPEYVKEVEAWFGSAPLEDWKTWLRWKLMGAASPYLSKAFFDENFAFGSAVLTGTKEQLPRWQTCSTVVDRTMGDALGHRFVEKHFPPEAKKRMLDLVENTRETLREELSKADWLTEETKKNAIAKLNAFRAKIGYPDRWRDYSKAVVTREDYLGSILSLTLTNREYMMAKIGKPVDRNDWGMTPPTVNAYYSPTFNEIAFPAGILQPPFFDMSADDAVNYGAIGVVIGHEMGHGFDDQGSKFDAEGNLKNWWTPEDRKKFDARAGCVIEQFDTLDVGEGLRHKGKLVVGEALGDLGGVALAHKAYLRSLKGKPAPVIDGLTGDQRFFYGFATVWARSHTPQDLRLRLNTDPHPIAKFRVNGTLQNVPEFHKAFDCKLGDPMVRPAEKQCELW